MTPNTSRTAPEPLSRGEGVAAWRQIVDGIEADIAAGILPPGAQLPPEVQLAERFGVNRHTLRRALAVLASRGLVRATQGRGTFVEARPLPYPVGPRTRFSEIVSAAGRTASGELVSARTVPADPHVARRLAIVEGADVLEIVTRRAADGTPIALATSYLPLPRLAGFPDLFRETGSITKAFALLGIPDYRRLESRITARPAAPEEASALDLVPGRLLLVLDTANVDPDGVPVQATRALFPADRVELVIEP